MPHALAVIDVTEGSSPRDIPVKQPARYHGSSWHDADDLADATTLVRNLGVKCRVVGPVGYARSGRDPEPTQPPSATAGLDGFEQPKALGAVVASERDHEANSRMLGGAEALATSAVEFCRKGVFRSAWLPQLSLQGHGYARRVRKVILAFAFVLASCASVTLLQRAAGIRLAGRARARAIQAILSIVSPSLS